MATITATVGLKDLEDFYATDGGFPSGTGSYSGGYSAKSATSGDTISITVFQHSSVNVGYTPTVQLVNTGGSASVSGSFGTSVTVTVTNVTGTGEIRILSAPGTSAGFTPAASQRYRAIIDLTVSAALVAPTISSVTPDNPFSPNVTATVNLSKPLIFRAMEAEELLSMLEELVRLLPLLQAGKQVINLHRLEAMLGFISPLKIEIVQVFLLEDIYLLDI